MLQTAWRWAEDHQAEKEGRSLPGTGVGRTRGEVLPGCVSTGHPNGILCTQVWEMWGRPGQMPQGLCAGEGLALRPSSLGEPPDTAEQGLHRPRLHSELVPDHRLDGAL